MNDSLVADSRLAVPLEVCEFAAKKGIGAHLNVVIDLARQAFAGSDVSVLLGQDAEDETHQYIALDVDADGLTAEELLAGQRIWSAGIVRVCPPRHAVYFVLGWR